MRQGLLTIVLGILFTSISGAKPVLTVQLSLHDFAGEAITWFGSGTEGVQPLYAAGAAGTGAAAAILLPARGESGRAGETSVPEPETFALIGFGLLLIGMVGARRYRH